MNTRFTTPIPYFAKQRAELASIGERHSSLPDYGRKPNQRYESWEITIESARLLLMNQEQVIHYWIESAEQDMVTANSLYDAGRYHHCLFFCHLALEKMLKSYVVRLGSQPPRTHDLGQLCKLAEIEVDTEMANDLDEINVFNLEGRYDDYHFSFYKKATKDYADCWLPICKKYYQLFKHSHDE